MAGQRCSNCNAALPLGDPGAVVACPFCGAQNRMAGGMPAPPVLPPLGARRTETTTTGRVILVVVLLSVFGTVGFIIWSVMRTVGEVVSTSRTVTTTSTTVTVTRSGGPVLPHGEQVPTNELFELTPEGNVLLKLPGVTVAPGAGTGTTTIVPPTAPPPPAERLVPPAELPTIAKDRWVKLDPAGLPGGFAAFEPTAAVPWILGVARHWSTDARFERIVVDGVRADGTLDLSTGEANVDYRLYSPALRESAAQSATVSAATSVWSELRLSLSQGRLEAMLGTHRGGFVSPDGFEVQCTMSKVLELLRGHGLSQLPTYELTMSCSGNRCKWSASPPRPGPALDDWNADLPDIPAGDCSRFPATPGRRGR